MNHKHHPSLGSSSLECSRKKACINSATCSSSESSQTRHLSLTRSMSDYNEHSYFVTPKSTSTPYKSDHQPCNHYASTESRCSWPPLDCSIYNNFCYRGHMDFGRGGATPGSIAGSQQVSSSMLQPGVVFSLAMPLAPSYLTPKQSAEVFCLGAE